MNPLPPNVDELVSVYLDGEATPDEVVTVESHPELLSRVEELRALSGVLASPPAAPAEQKEAHLSAALSLFDDLFADQGAPVAAPVLAAVPPAAVPPNPVSPTDSPAAHDSTAADVPPVVSLASARERRRPRRFNTGVIAAAAAALLLFVSLAAISFGRNSSEDIATAADTQIESAEAVADDSADSSAAAEDAMDDDAPSSAGLSEVDESSRAVEPPAATMQADEASAAEAPMDDAAPFAEADSDDAASDDAASDDAASDDAENFAADGADQAGDAEPFADDLYLGDFVDDESLREELDQFTAQDLRKRTDLFEPGLFPGCQQALAELAKQDVVTFVGEATLDRQLVELHILSSDEQGISFLIVDPGDCSIISTIP